jgi:hypothetical protein
MQSRRCLQGPARGYSSEVLSVKGPDMALSGSESLVVVTEERNYLRGEWEL